MNTPTKVIVKTKSNYRSLNGIELPIVEIVGTRVSCKVFDDEIGKFITSDFGLSEVVKFIA